MADTTIVHASTWDAVKLIPSIEQRYNALALLLEYGLNDITPHSDDPFVQMVVTMALPNINAAAMRYDAAVANGAKGAEYGKKGGRPQKVTDEELIELKAKGFTQRQIAGQTDTDVKTVQRRLSAISQKGHNPSKPLDIDTDIDIDTDTDTDIDTDIDNNIDDNIDKDINTNKNKEKEKENNTDKDDDRDTDGDTDTRGYAGGYAVYESNPVGKTIIDPCFSDNQENNQIEQATHFSVLAKSDSDGAYSSGAGDGLNAKVVLDAFGVDEKSRSKLLKKFFDACQRENADSGGILEYWAAKIKQNNRMYESELLPPKNSSRTADGIFEEYALKAIWAYVREDELPF